MCGMDDILKLTKKAGGVITYPCINIRQGILSQSPKIEYYTYQSWLSPAIDRLPCPMDRSYHFLTTSDLIRTLNLVLNIPWFELIYFEIDMSSY